jgi:alpha-amylase/alpha-mannosidase (GH57 family)
MPGNIFHDNGYHFLGALYRRLASHPAIELTTFSDCLKNKTVVKPLSKLVAGSWVYGTFSTWIGSRRQKSWLGHAG